MIVGIICSAVAGAFISVQAAVNAKMNVYLGAWATTVLVFIVGLLGSLVPLVLFGGNLQGLFDISPIYALGGLLGVGVVFCVMRSIQLLGPTLSVSNHSRLAIDLGTRCRFNRCVRDAPVIPIAGSGHRTDGAAARCHRLQAISSHGSSTRSRKRSDFTLKWLFS